MPLLGYGGYLPFALEIYAFYRVIHNLVVRPADRLLGFDETQPGTDQPRPLWRGGKLVDCE